MIEEGDGECAGDQEEYAHGTNGDAEVGTKRPVHDECLEEEDAGLDCEEGFVHNTS